MFFLFYFFPNQLTPSEEAFLRSYAGVVHSQMSQLPQHNIDQGKVDTNAQKPNTQPICLHRATP